MDAMTLKVVDGMPGHQLQALPGLRLDAGHHQATVQVQTVRNGRCLRHFSTCE